MLFLLQDEDQASHDSASAREAKPDVTIVSLTEEEIIFVLLCLFVAKNLDG